MEILIDGVKYVPEPIKPTDKNILAALEVRFDSDAGDQLTVREYLKSLLTALWNEQERFSGKRPFGNSGWEYDLYFPLAQAGFIDLGPLDDEGEPYEWSPEQMRFAHAYVCDLIAAAFFGVDG